MSPIKPMDYTDECNRLRRQLAEYIWGREKHSEFTRASIQRQIDSIQDYHSRASVEFVFLFSIDKIEEGVALAEALVLEAPLDIATWGNYSICALRKIGAPKAAEILARATRNVVSPSLLEHACMCFSSLGDYESFLYYFKQIEKMDALKLIEFADIFSEMAVMARRVIDAGKTESIKALATLMHSMLPEKCLGSPNNYLYTVDDDGDITYVFELLVEGLEPSNYGELNAELIRRNCATGKPDLSVVGFFVDTPSVEWGKLNVSYTE
ncbi:MAG: hypothetical protein ACRC5A_07265 [Enterobacteriaceae bacterium]